MNKLNFQIRKAGEVRMGEVNVFGDVTLSEDEPVLGCTLAN